MSRPVGRHRARRDTGIGALRRPAVAATAAISTVSLAAAAYSTAATASATATGSAQAHLVLGVPAASTALNAADSGVATDAQAQLAAAQQAVSARKSADAKSRSAAAARAAAADKLQSAARASARAAQQAASDKKAAATKAAKQKAAASREKAQTSRDTTRPPAASFGGSPQAYAAAMLSSYGWDQGQMSCLVSLWNRESGWRANATNPSSGAYGIPQSLPGSKMASAGADWQTNPATQIRWGLGYIKATYGSPCGAWGHSQATGWY